MTTPDFRALCAELVKVWDTTADFDFNDFGHAAADIVTRARAALAAESVGEGLSETAWALSQLLDGVQRHDLPNMTGLSDLDCDRIWAARWGTPNPITEELK
jgi:hypothetical protein